LRARGRPAAPATAQGSGCAGLVIRFAWDHPLRRETILRVGDQFVTALFRLWAKRSTLLTERTFDVHIVHMKEISIRDLHLNTGKWIRKISLEQRIVITERGEPVATLIPFESAHKATPFRRRELVQGFATLPPIEHDSAEYISTDRDRA
jgi:antitoxin (DNA-binding transcriptional repressor) of toxin-antitoxin stability system